jgi:hypothetical protein
MPPPGIIWNRLIEAWHAWGPLHAYGTALYWCHLPPHKAGFHCTLDGGQEAAKELKAGGVCPPTKLGESWYEEYVRAFLRKCGTKCSHISLLPVFQLTVGRPNSHMGSFGHGKDGHNLDCRMYCSNVVDQWNVLMFNLLC